MFASLRNAFDTLVETARDASYVIRDSFRDRRVADRPAAVADEAPVVALDDAFLVDADRRSIVVAAPGAGKTDTFVQTLHPTVVAEIVVPDLDTTENVAFPKTHPRFADAAAAARAFVASGPRPAREIAEHLRGEGGVPEFRVASKSVSNRLRGFGLEKSEVEGVAVWGVAVPE